MDDFASDQDQCNRFTIYLSLLTPSFLHHSDLVKLLSSTLKSLRIFRTLPRRSTVTRPYQERSCEPLSKVKGGKLGEADQRHLCAKTFNTIITAEMVNNRQEACSDSWDDDQTGSPILNKDLKLSKKSPRWLSHLKKEWVWTCSFNTPIDIIFTVGKSAGGKGQPACASSPRRPPRRRGRKMWEIAWQRTSPRHSDGETSARVVCCNWRRAREKKT